MNYRRKLLLSFILIIGFALSTIFIVLKEFGQDVDGADIVETSCTIISTTPSVETLSVPETPTPTPTNTVTPTPSPTATPTCTPSPSPTPEVVEVEADEDDLYLMAHLIWAETGYDHEEMMYAVGSVVLNRVNHGAYPDTIYDVIYQSGQYQCTWDGNFNKTPSELAWEVAEELLNNGSTLPEDVVYQAQFTQGSGVYEQIENQYFCYY